jgi:hypothetical protein
VNGEPEFCARSVKPFGRGRPWLWRTPLPVKWILNVR